MKTKTLVLTLAAVCVVGGAGAWYVRHKPAAQATQPSDTIMAGLLASPEQVEPMSWGLVANQLFNQGDRLRAAFCFYVFQVRTLPYVKALAGTDAGNTVMASRNGLNQMVGAQINEWIGTDPEAVYEVARQAIAYEATLSQDNMRPQQVPPEVWKVIVAQERQAYVQEMEHVLGTPQLRQAVADARRANGFAVGPLKDSGAPLPPEWVSPAASQ